MEGEGVESPLLDCRFVYQRRSANRQKGERCAALTQDPSGYCSRHLRHLPSSSRVCAYGKGTNSACNLSAFEGSSFCKRHGKLPRRAGEKRKDPDSEFEDNGPVRRRMRTAGESTNRGSADDDGPSGTAAPPPRRSEKSTSTPLSAGTKAPAIPLLMRTTTSAPVAVASLRTIESAPALLTTESANAAPAVFLLNNTIISKQEKNAARMRTMRQQKKYKQKERALNADRMRRKREGEKYRKTERELNLSRIRAAREKDKGFKCREREANANRMRGIRSEDDAYREKEIRVNADRMRTIRSENDGYRDRERAVNADQMRQRRSGDGAYRTGERERNTERMRVVRQQEAMTHPSDPSAVPREEWPHVASDALKAKWIREFLQATELCSLKESACSVCSELTLVSKLVRLAVHEFLQFKDLLQVSPRQERLRDIMVYPSAEELDGFVLDRKGLKYADGGALESVSVCKSCLSFLAKEKLPPLALANDIYTGSPPPELVDLTPVEESFIAKYRCRVCIVKLTATSRDPASQQRAMKGNCITFPQSPSDALNAFPRSIESVLDTIHVVFIGSRRPTAEVLRRVRLLTVRRSKVRAALLWLKAKNPLYADIVINNEVLTSLPENDVLSEMMERVTFIDDDDNDGGRVASSSSIDEAERSRYDNSRQEESINVDHHGDHSHDPEVPESDSVLERTGMVDPEATVVNETHRQRAVISSVMENHHLLYPHAPDPVNEFNNPDLLPGMFPTLFPYGVGGFDDNLRRVKVDFHMHLKHLLLCSTKEFCTHPSFLFVTFNMLQRRRACSSTRLLMRQPTFASTAADINSITAQDVVRTLQSDNSSGGLYSGTLGTLARQLRIAGGRIPGTVESKKAMRNEIRALSVFYGPPTFYVTINPADIHNAIVLQYAGKEVPLTPEEQNRLFPYQLRARIVASDPVAVTRFFEVWVLALIKHVLGWGQEEGGVFGTLDAFYGVIEVQGRGSLHTHAVLYIRGALPPLDVREKMTEPLFADRMFAYLTDVIKNDFQDLLTILRPQEENNTELSAAAEEQHDNNHHHNNSSPTTQDISPIDIQDTETTLTEESRAEEMLPSSTSSITLPPPSSNSPHPSLLRPPAPLTPSTGNEETPPPLHSSQLFRENISLAQDLYALLQKTQVHTHSPTCYKYGFAECRFQLPADIVDRPCFDRQTGKLHTRRLDGMVNPYNDILSLCARCNVDVKYIGASGNQALAILYYITCYITKSGLTTHNAFALAKASLEKVFVNSPNPNPPTSLAIGGGRTTRNIMGDTCRTTVSCSNSESTTVISGNNISDNPATTTDEDAITTGTPATTIVQCPQNEARRKILRCLIASCAQQELSATQVAALVLSIGGKGGDHFTSHRFVSLVTTPFYHYLQREDGLACTTTTSTTSDNNSDNADDRHDDNEDQFPINSTNATTTRNVDQAEEFTLQRATTTTGASSSRAHYVPVNDRLDYIYRDDALSSISLYDFKSLYKKITLTSEKRRLQRRTGRRKHHQNGITNDSNRSNMVVDNEAEHSEDEIVPEEREPTNGTNEEEEEEAIFLADNLNEYSGIGRRATTRYLFTRPHPQMKTHALRKLTEPIIPVLLGRSIPRRDDETKRDEYACLILLLFKPWKSLHDLKPANRTWYEAFTAWLQLAPTNGGPSQETIKRINNIEYLKRSADEASAEATARRQRSQRRVSTDNSTSEQDRILDYDTNGDDYLHGQNAFNDEDVDDFTFHIDDNAISSYRLALDHKTQQWQEEAMRQVSLVLALPPNTSAGHSIPLTDPNTGRRQLTGDAERLKSWTAEMARLREQILLTRRSPLVHQPSAAPNHQSDPSQQQLPQPYIVQHHDQSPLRETLLRPTSPPSHATSQPTLLPSAQSSLTIATHARSFNLTTYQSKVHKLFCEDGVQRLGSTTSSPGNDRQQLLACLLGEGGTGKTRTINAIVDFFCKSNMAHTLRVAAPTGCAAANISASTIHSMINWRPGKNLDDDIDQDAVSSTMPNQAQVESEWASTTHLILDEISMIGCAFLFELHLYLCRAKRQVDKPFGGISVLLCGDFFQFPPVSDSPLYLDPPDPKQGRPLSQKHINAYNGRRLWLAVDRVFILTEQMRAGDPELRRILSNIRSGKKTREDYEALCRRIVGQQNEIDLADPQWKNPTWIVTRNTLRSEINDKAVVQQAITQGQPLLSVPSTDTWKRNIPAPDFLRNQLRSLPDNKTERLPSHLYLTPNCPVQLTHNLYTELNLTNGSIGSFKGLVYIQQTRRGMAETLCNHGTPLYALVEFPPSQTLPRLEGLPPNVIPIAPVKRSFKAKVNLNGKSSTITVKRHQLPLTLAYALSDYKVQGRTLTGKVVVDLCPAPYSRRDLAAIACYVALSRITTLENLAILRPFDIDALYRPPPIALTNEMTRLQQLEARTMSLL